MPELSRFERMVIYMLFRDNQEHNKPHVHVYYGEYEASIGIAIWKTSTKTDENGGWMQAL